VCCGKAGATKGISKCGRKSWGREFKEGKANLKKEQIFSNLGYIRKYLKIVLVRFIAC